MKKIYILLAGLIALSTACSTYRYEEHQSRVSQMGSTGIITSTTADLNVSPNRITHLETFTQKKNENDLDLRYIKEKTLSNAMHKYKADVIVGALYDITTSEDGATITVSVTGYPANYVNFRKTTSEDSLLLAVSSTAEKGDVKSSSLLRWGVKIGWQNTFNVVYGLTTTIGGEYNGGYRFSHWGLAGLGFGYQYDLDGKTHYIPVYAQFKVYFLGKKRVNPYIGVNQGVGIRLNSEGAQPILTFGSHTRGEIGVNFRLSPTTSLNLSYDIGTSPWIDYYTIQPAPITGSEGTLQMADPFHQLYQGLRFGITF